MKQPGPIAWKRGRRRLRGDRIARLSDRPEKGKLIRGLGELEGQKDVLVFHAGTKRVGNEYYTSGGRVLGVTALGRTYAEAIERPMRPFRA